MPLTTLCYHFVNNVHNTFSFELAQHWMQERGISCMALSVEFIYLTALVARKWIKERGITYFTQLWGTTKSLMLVFKFVYVGEFTSRRRRVGVGEFARRRVDRIPYLPSNVFLQRRRSFTSRKLFIRLSSEILMFLSAI